LGRPSRKWVGETEYGAWGPGGDVICGARRAVYHGDRRRACARALGGAERAELWVTRAFGHFTRYPARMPEASLLETFAVLAEGPFVIEHVAGEFTSLCPITGHPDFGRIVLRYCPRATCVELKSLKLYYQSFRNQGIFYEALTNQIRDDLAKLLSPRWLQVVSVWRGRGGIRSRIIATHGNVPAEWARG